MNGIYILFHYFILQALPYLSPSNTFMSKGKDLEPVPDPDPQHCFFTLNCDAAGVQVHVLREHSGGGRERHTQEGQQAHARQVQ